MRNPVFKEGFNTYEVYTKNPITGERGWDIKFVEAENEEQLQQFPNFDCVISVNDFIRGSKLYDCAGKRLL